ncbi:MAG: alpha/beta fold hydrolase [Panacagrimonas sp.]
MPRTHKMLNANGVRIHAVEEGEGPLVVLIHGFPESWYSWRHQLTALAAAGFKAVAIDQRGYGQSSKFREQSEYRIGKLVADVAGVIDCYGVRQAFIVGHDWGAPVAWTFAWLHPEKCRGVVGISVPFADRALIGLPGNPFGEHRPRDYHNVLAGPGKEFYQDYFGAQDDVIAEIEEDVRGWLKGIIWTVSGDAIGSQVAAAVAAGVPPMDPIQTLRSGPLCVAPGARLKDAFAYPEAMPVWMTDTDLDFFASEFERSGFGGPLSYYHNIDASWQDLAGQSGKPLTPPAMFIGGEFDVGTIWGYEAIAMAGQRMTDYRSTQILSGCGHWIQQERPDDTNRLLISFLRELI